MEISIIGILMDIETFKAFCYQYLKQRKFKKLMLIPAFEDQEVKKYLQGRGFEERDFKDLGAFAFKGNFEYQGKVYNLPKSLVISLLDPINGQIRGAWIRAIHEKKFYIWMVSEEFQKYWVSPLADLSQPCILHESILDAVSYSKITGNPNIAATLGVSITNDLKEIIPLDSILSFDNDRAGRINMLREIESNPRLQLLKTNLGKCKDFNEFLTHQETHNPKFEVLKGVQAKIYLRSLL